MQCFLNSPRKVSSASYQLLNITLSLVVILFEKREKMNNLGVTDNINEVRA